MLFGYFGAEKVGGQWDGHRDNTNTPYNRNPGMVAERCADQQGADGFDNVGYRLVFSKNLKYPRHALGGNKSGACKRERKYSHKSHPLHGLDTLGQKPHNRGDPGHGKGEEKNYPPNNEPFGKRSHRAKADEKSDDNHDERREGVSHQIGSYMADDYG